MSKLLLTEEVEFFKNNKDQITFELLQALRSHGNDGKQLALDILDFEKDNDQYYLNAFEERISFNGNRRLKKAFTKLNLSQIHLEEIERCYNDIHYFKDNYIKIKTKAGVNFPDLRDYQDKFINDILPDENEGIIGLMGRQSGKSISTGIYLAHKYNFGEDMNIGIVANKGPMAREFLANVKNMLIELPIWMQQGSTVWNKGSIENEKKMRILTDVPSQDAFRGFTISILVVDETAFIRPTIWEEFSDSIFPSQSGLAWKKNVLISTSKGMNHFYQLVKGARDGSNGFVINEVNWRDVPRYNPDGSLMSPEEFKEKIIKKHGEVYFQQNYGNEFIGSSYTLISADKLKELSPVDSITTMAPGLKVYVKPIQGHKYILSVDPAKDGRDAFAVNILDITDLRFEQVAAGQLQVDYLLMPEFLLEWAEWYNHAFMIIETNEGSGQSVADMLYKTYEYENLYFDVKTDSGTTNLAKSRKKYPGFRTTTKSRKLILQTMKTFIENNNLIIRDKGTIDEFFTFILENGKYQADEGAFDDAVMCLAIAFAPFVSVKNFNDIKSLINTLYNKVSDAEESKVDLSEIFTIGGFDDGVMENNNFGNIQNNMVDEFGGLVNYYDTLDISNFG